MLRVRVAAPAERGRANAALVALLAGVLRRGVFPSKRSLVSAIIDYIEKFNREGRVFRWTKTAQAIIASSNNLTGHYMCHPNRRLAQHVVPGG